MPCVLLALDYRASNGGSFIPAIQRLALALRRRGCEPLVAVPAVPHPQPWTEWFARANVEIVRTRTYSDIARLVAERRPVATHAHFSGYMVPAAVASLLHRRRLFWHVHSAMPARAPWARRVARRAKFGLLSRGISGILAVSEPLREELIGLGAPDGRVHVVANAIDTERFRAPSPQERSSARAALGIDGARRVLLFFGRDGYVKGADFLAEALERCTDPPLLLCAATPPEVLARLPSRTRAISAGTVGDTRPLYWAADAIVMPSRYEGTPLTLLEARAVGLPAFTSTIPSFVRLAERDPGVWLVEHTSPQDFARALDRRWAPIPLPETLRASIALDAWCANVIARYGLHEA